MSVESVNITERVQSHYQDKKTVVAKENVEQLKFRQEIKAQSSDKEIQEFVESNKNVSEKFLNDIQSISRLMNRKIQFSMDYKNNEMIVSIIDRDTKEVIRQLPPEELRRLHQKLQETAEMLGLIVDAKA